MVFLIEGDEQMKLNVELKDNSYPIYIEKGITNKLSEFVDLKRKVMIITDKNIPEELVNRIMNQCDEAYKIVLIPGEQSKSFEIFTECHQELLLKEFSRNDLIIAVGGGVIGDLAGFVSSTYKRGIDFINIPTTTLSQIDSSVGGKTAINLDGYKNMIGTFYQPKAVFIDFDSLKTLTQRHYNNGLVEAIKAGLIRDKSLFELFEQEDIDIEEIIIKAIKVKKEVVEIDEKEMGLRKILNFGHTIGHGVEAYYHNSQIYHGEGVAIGMMKMIDDKDIKIRLEKILTKLSINTDVEYNKDEVYDYICNDKKVNKDLITIVKISEIGKAYIEDIEMAEIRRYL
jgi:3-dehydroquinate synthase